MASNNDPLQGLTIDQIDVTDPQTRKFLYDNVDLDDPETREYFQGNPVQGARSWGERALDSAKLAALEGTTNFGIRQLKDLFDYNKGTIRSNYEGALSRGELTEADIERMTDEYNRGVETMARTAIRKRMDQDPGWRPEEGFFSNLGRLSGDLIGGLGGSIGPEMILPGAFGKTVMSRIGSAMGISGGLDAALQGADIVQGVEEEFDPMRFGTSVAAGGALQGIGEGASALLNRGRLSPDVEAQLQDMYQTSSLQEIEGFAAANGATIDREGLAAWIADRDSGKDVSPTVTYRDVTDGVMPTNQMELDLVQEPRQMEMDFDAPDLEGRLQQEASDFRMRNAQQEPSPESVFPPREEQLELPLEAEPQFRFDGPEQGSLDIGDQPPRRAPVDTIIEVTPRMKSVMDYSDKLTSNWKNGPEVHVYDTFEGLNDIDPYALGAYTPEGQVILNASLIERDAKALGISPQKMANTVLFHEGLGHFGLAQKFREGLDRMLGKWLDNSPQFRQAVQTWKNKNAGKYDDADIDLDIRAAEEVLAVLSEKGVLPKPLLNQAMNFIKATARKMGLKLNYSMREIKTILSQSHDAVVNGRGADVRGNGFTPRYMKSNQTIEIDGVSRPITNSKGNRLGRTPEEIKNFWEWFGDSKVVDKSGRPLDVFHGTAGDFSTFDLDRAGSATGAESAKGGIFFTSRKKTADYYARSATTEANIYKMPKEKLSPSTMEVNLSLQNPLVHDMKGKVYRETTYNDLVKKAKESGNDGLIIRRTFDAGEYGRFDALLRGNISPEDIYVAFSPNQVKSASGNSGAFDPNNPDIRYMKSSFGKGSEGPLRGKAAADDKASYDRSNVLNAYRTKDDVQDILDEVTPEKTRESFDQWIDEAGTTKNSRKIAEGLSTGTTPAELLVAEDYLLRTVNKAKELSRMAAEGRATERDTYLLGEALERASVVAGKIQEVVANAARILNVRKIEIATDKQLSKTLRQMLSSLTPDQMNNPQKILKVAERLDKGDEKAKAIAGLLRAKTELLSLPRSIMSSLDLSAPFRQGVFLVGRQDFWKNIIPMFKMFGDEANYKSMMDSIKDRPNYRLMEQSRLGITDLGGNLHAREEDFISSWAEKIPVIGRGVRASGRAYTGFLNKLRADTFDSLLGNYRDMGIEPTPEQLRGIAKYVNNATGRGDLKSFEQAAPDLAAVFFSPRLIASRINLLNPVQYAKMDPILRREAVKDLLKFGTITGTVLGLASASGARVETDPRSSDFAKIRVGDTRYDILGGFGQYLTLGARLMTLEKKNAAGEVKSLRRQPGEERDYGSDNIMDVALDFFTNKFSPLASLARDYVVGENPVGDPFEPTDAVVSRMVPLFFQDAYELIKAEGAVGVPMIAPALFGIGVQNYAVDLGYDVLGRDIEELQISGEDNDPISVQIRSLKEETGKDVFGPSRPPKFDGVPIEKNEWSQVIGHYTNEFLKEDTNLPEFVNGTPEEKVAIMKAARKDAYQEAKAYFQQQLEEQGVTIDETGNE